VSKRMRRWRQIKGDLAKAVTSHCPLRNMSYIRGVVNIAHSESRKDNTEFVEVVECYSDYHRGGDPLSKAKKCREEKCGLPVQGVRGNTKET